MLKDKERQISSLKKQVRHAEEDVVKGFRDSDAFLYELGSFFADGFNTDEFFGDNPIFDAQGDGGATLQNDQVKSVNDETCPLEETKTVDKEKDEETLID